jgi:hypothetical protein
MMQKRVAASQLGSKTLNNNLCEKMDEMNMQLSNLQNRADGPRTPPWAGEGPRELFPDCGELILSRFQAVRVPAPSWVQEKSPAIGVSDDCEAELQQMFTQR